MKRSRFRRVWRATTCATVAFCWLAVARPEGRAPLADQAQLRRPIGAVFLDDGQTLCVANQRSGSVSLVDLATARLQAEFAVGQHVTGVDVLPDRRHVLVVDDERHELIALQYEGKRMIIRARLAVGPYPASVAVEPDGTRATVVSLWSRRVAVVDLTPLNSASGPINLAILHEVHLPFAARNQCVLPGKSQVIVADAFGGHLAVVDVARGKLLAVHELAGHNIRGLALSADGKQILLAHQLLHQHVSTTREHIESGTLMDNVVRLLSLDDVLQPDARLAETSRLIPLGGVGAGAGDPAGIAVLDANQIIVALAGVQEVALVSLAGQPIQRIAVGRRPTVVLAGTSGQPAVVLNTFADSVSLLDLQRGLVERAISLGPQPRLAYRDRGELLFYDARLGRDGWLSCHSCHTDGHTNGLLADTFGDHSFGTPKRTLTLMNTRMTDPWGWTGGMQYLHDQVRKSLVETMHSPEISLDVVSDLTSFLHTLPPPPPLEPATNDETDRHRLEHGRQIFEERGCIRCHIPPLTYASHGTHDVGFADERGQSKFNPPSLRGVSQGYGFLHDNRATKLEEVFTKFRHKVGSNMPPSDLADLLRFLRSL